MRLSQFSVYSSGGILTAVVPGGHDEALSRLRRDDGLWCKDTVYYHGSWDFDAETARCRPTNRLHFGLCR